MPLSKIKKLLDRNNIKYIIIKHSPAYTAQEIAALTHVSGRKLAKTVMIKVNGQIAMAVLPASFKVSFEQLKTALGAEKVRLAYEQEFMDKFPDCEVGAMPPFGNLYGMEVYVADNLAEDKNDEIAFNACSHSELIKMSYKDFEKIVNPKILRFSTQVKV
ncbi:prolyl-tRNA editing protein ProX [bacterium BMS3Abin03]|nr:prolyl-tRNA editing protein ProX [bacterium BMS3Abin03]